MESSRARAGVWVGLVGLVLVAGCSGPRVAPPSEEAGPVRDAVDVWPLLSAPVYGEVVKEQVWVPALDGKRLDNWLFRPKTPAGVLVPVVINFSPYWGNLAETAESGGDAFSRHLIDWLLPRGYAVVLSSVRGTGDSEGCFTIGGAVEVEDARRVVEHFARAGWSSGQVAAAGKSYDGTVAQAVATLAPPALKAILPVSAVSEWYRYTYMNGLPYGGGHGAEFNQRFPQDVGWEEGRPGPQDVCPEYAQVAGEGRLTAAVGDYDAYWQERDYAGAASEARAALFYVHGLQDWNVKPDHVPRWLAEYGGPMKVWLHQSTTKEDGGHVYPLRQDWNYSMLRFLDHFLKGIDTGLELEPVVEVEDSAGTWRFESEWPPASAASLPLFLSGGGQLLASAPAVREVGFVDDGQRPDPASRTDANQLVYVSEPFAGGLRIVGSPRLHVSASSTLPAGKVAATLYDFDGGSKWGIRTWGGLNLRHREDTRAPEPVVPGTVYEASFGLHPVDWVLPAGHRLGLALAGNAGWGDYRGFEASDSRETITVREGASTFLEVSVQGGATLEPLRPQPLEVEACWAC